MRAFLKKEQWSPYIAGLFIGLLAMGSLLIFHKTIGTSTTFVKLAALIWSFVDAEHLYSNAYYQDYLNNKAWVDWQVMLVIGIFLGAYLSRRMSSTDRGLKKRTSSPSRPSNKRLIQAFVGGVIVMFGARLAGGCTSGHAISGGFQLAVSGWLFMIGVFALGIPTALIIYRKKSGGLS